ncbi:MAG: outer membrane lipoprotein-sorting protein [Zetaproteobacteria bacterium CG12_big_fil_rev_8_21_14_0_65_55_1124]|nr:MAG: outer membrane lipoprotein-sorting protein [Zetaproteobacteria bacterium CG1_02_55_237]PIS18467.1 MAG: outer membrane lipoprotein-sorting protein [Zetaproteobacteria bacterium CG08_land_8_20_14_0_20_55_17]PIW42225.1 MAG: outer membrane lipoprotein-sorting protein [Zetaproteobacteria bacterium CG12_big_fil_rev_8_21_14_0_65_55_1124]PIY53794.1 MAG: outer membrane lipoprotein-sorting protein [Zetaproteobacteria bacterium CG_4_10_14_0_8_um_filter_55_43]PIZ38487.1 MAG: outer membrane lipoprot
MTIREFSRYGMAWTIALSILAAVAQPAHAMQVEELIHHIDELWRGETSRANMTMTVKTRRYERSMTLEAWSRGKEYSLVVIREPVKDRGIATLKVIGNIWNYLPKINRVTKVPSSMMSGSWMGSHFTNDDLVKESTYEDDYNSSITFEGKRDGKLIYEISSLPKPNAAVVWGKVVMEIDQQTLAPYRARYFDEEGALIRTLSFDQDRTIDGRAVPMRLSLQPEDKPEESTVILYQDIRFGVPLEAGFFSLQNLQKRR